MDSATERRERSGPDEAERPEHGGSRPGESEKERIDRNWDELLAGLRVALPGVQVLFAFLLILPFQAGFAEVTGFQKGVYFATLLFTSLATVFFVAPPIRHRLLFRRRLKEEIVFRGNRLAIIGYGFLGAAIIGAILLVTTYIFSIAVGVPVAASLAVVVVIVWIAGALMMRNEE